MNNSNPSSHRDRLRQIRRFDQLVAYLRDELNWPIASEDFEELTFEYTSEELGIDSKNAAKIQEIKRLRPLVTEQPWGIFFVKFAPKRLPVVALRRILGQVALKSRNSANSSMRRSWDVDDLLFVSNYGEGEERHIALAHFSTPRSTNGLPTLKVLGWDNRDTALHLDHVADKLTHHLKWPDGEDNPALWRERWRGMFTLRHREVITTSKLLSKRLAEIAIAIRDVTSTALEIETESGPLTALMQGCRQALVDDLDERAFADMYAQTVVYGLLSARITDPEHRTTSDLATNIRTNPFLRELMSTFFNVRNQQSNTNNYHIDFDELGISEVIELLDRTDMESVLRDFGDLNPQEDPVIHFYEHFLFAYDRTSKLKRGVFYTPRAVVSFIVRSVDVLLRRELGIEDGLADTITWAEVTERNCNLTVPHGTSPHMPFVQILDPCTGTGTFLVEVIDIIYDTMVKKWKSQGYDMSIIQSLWKDYVPIHLLPRLYGYEILMAPYTIAHLKIGLKLYETGYRFENNERAQIYITNALEPAADTEQLTLEFIPALAKESSAVSVVKKTQHFTVVLGNPPYSGISCNKNPWIEGLLKGTDAEGNDTASYYHVNGERLGERKVWLQDDYVKFIRLSQWLIDRAGTGILAFITNHGYLDNLTFRGMRLALTNDFQNIRVLDLHGNVKKKEVSPGGREDHNVFDIQQGVAIGLFTKTTSKENCTQRADLWGDREYKSDWLNQHLYNDVPWVRMYPEPKFYFFEQSCFAGKEEYFEWPAINDIMPINVTGVVTARDKFTIDFDKEVLVDRVNMFLNHQLSDEDVKLKLGLSENYSWRIARARHELRANTKGKRIEDFIENILYRPFDERLIFWDPSIVWRPRKEAMPHMLAGENIALITCKQQARDSDEWAQVYVTSSIMESGAISNVTREINSIFPLYLYPGIGKASNSLHKHWTTSRDDRYPNLELDVINRFEEATGFTFSSDSKDDQRQSFDPEDVLCYIYAVFHSPKYRARYKPQLQLDFPRVPLPTSAGLFRSLTGVGRQLLLLHTLRASTCQNHIATLKGPKNPEISNVGWADNTVWIDARKTNARSGNIATQLGTIGFQGVSKEVYDFRIGVYQVCHKWLHDRRGRTLTEIDVNHYQNIVTTLSDTILCMTKIDNEIEKFDGWPNAFHV